MSNRATYQQYLLSKGLSPTQVGGILLNIEDESGFDPGVNEQSPTVAGSRGGFGLFQHTGPRRAALEGYARARGKPADDWQAQLDFALTEPDMQKYLAQNYSTPGAAAVSFLRGFERPAEKHAEAREQKYLGSAGYTIPASAITGDPSVYSGGSIMPVSAIPQGTLMPDATQAQPQQQQPQGLFGNLDPALGGLIGLSMLAGSFGGGQQGGVGGALASVLPLLMPQQGKAPAAPKMGTTTIKRGDDEVTFLTKDGVPVQEIGSAPRWQPPGAADNTTAAQKNFEYLRDVVKLPPGEAADRAFKTGVTVNTGDSAAPVAAPEGGSWTDFKKGEYVVQTPGGPKIRKVPMEQAATEGEATKAAQLGVARDMVSRMQELRAEGVSVGGLKGVGEEWRSRPGALNAMADWASSKFGFPRESGVTEMLTLSSRLEKELIAAMRGASVGPEEEKAFRVTLPVPSQPDDIFDANLDLTLRNIDELARRKEEARSGDTTPDLAPTDDDMQEILDLIP